MSRVEALREASCRLFRQVYHGIEIKRTGERILMGVPVGPGLKSYWPNKVRDVVNFGERNVSSEVPLGEAAVMGEYARGVQAAHRSLPLGLHQIYRENIAEWRKRRGGLLKKGETKVTAMSMGKKK